MESFIYSTLHSLVVRLNEPVNVDTTTQLDTSQNYYNEDSDYDITLEAPNDSISERILTQRHNILKTSSPKKFKHHHRTTPEPTFPSKKNQSVISSQSKQNKINEERAKIHDFVDIGQMISSLQAIDDLIRDPNVNYQDFKDKYVQSSINLIDSIKDKDIFTEGTFQPNSPKAGRIAKEKLEIEKETQFIDQRQVIVDIITLSYQIFKISIELLSPIIIQMVSLFKQFMENELVIKILNIIGQILLIVLTYILNALKNTQLKSKSKLKNK